MRATGRQLIVWAATVLPAWSACASETGEAHHGLPLESQRLFDLCGIPITNSMIECIAAGAMIVLVAQLATRKMTFVPGRLQNFVEWLVESLYEFLEGFLGAHLVKRTFWVLATLFIFILMTNWVGLLPGGGSIGWGVQTPHGFKVTEPLMRGANADVNMTLGFALFFTVMWFVWSLQEQGPVGMFKHLFAPKGGMKGWMLGLMTLLFFFVGLVEVFQVLLVRPLAFTFRLYGNIYAGENLMETLLMFKHGGWLVAVLGYFLEILVGLIQATVFMLLAAAFTLLMCQHEESGESTGDGAHPAQH